MPNEMQIKMAEEICRRSIPDTHPDFKELATDVASAIAKAQSEAALAVVRSVEQVKECSCGYICDGGCSIAAARTAAEAYTKKI